MRNEHYPISPGDDFCSFEFESIGPKGVVRKIVVFEDIGDETYNVAFGDKIGEDWTDQAVTNNQDLVKVMATVIRATLVFSEKYPNRRLLVRPLDSKRKLLYHAIFKRNFDEINQVFKVFGIIGRKYHPFSAERNFEKFLLVRKLS